MAKITMVMTREINERIATDVSFASLVGKSLSRFAKGDWGTVTADDKAANDKDWESLAGGRYGRILAAYGQTDNKFWIIRDTEAITILYPSEY